MVKRLALGQPELEEETLGMFLKPSILDLYFFRVVSRKLQN